MSLSKKEVEKIIKKLREKYSGYADKYGPTWFDLHGFEERYEMARKNKMNMEGFVLAEITNFEKVKQKYDEKKNETSFSEQVDRIIEENTEKIKKYPEIKFHNSAGLEISHFYGAMVDFACIYFPVLWILSDDKAIKDQLFQYEDVVSFLGSPGGDKPAKRIEDHVFLLKRKESSELEIEKDRNDYLKESAFILHDIIDFCDGLIESRNQILENPLRMDKLYLSESRKRDIVSKFTGLTGYGAVLKVREYAVAIINDFRLSSFRRKS
ncbi:hypothetical protein ACFL20_06980 [Spirochaetota bacterium]